MFFFVNSVTYTDFTRLLLDSCRFCSVFNDRSLIVQWSFNKLRDNTAFICGSSEMKATANESCFVPQSVDAWTIIENTAETTANESCFVSQSIGAWTIIENTAETTANESCFVSQSIGAWTIIENTAETTANESCFVSQSVGAWTIIENTAETTRIK